MQAQSSRYRWVILGVFMLVNLTIQVLWISFAPITVEAAQFYGVSELQIGLLAMIFMIVYVPLSIPISWAIDVFGFRKAVGTGVILMGVFGLLRGVFATNFALVFVASVGVAVAQPFLLNSITTVAAHWFPIQERATAAGLAMVAGFLGIAIGQVFSPVLALSYGIPTMLLIFGAGTALSAVVFLLFTRDAPAQAGVSNGRALVLEGLRSMLRMRAMWVLIFFFLVGMGVFNGVSTWIEGIGIPKGFSATQSGELGGMLLLGGIIGAIVFSALSDHFRNRRAFIFIGLVMSLPGLAGITFANQYLLVSAAMFELGFSLMSLAPIGYQYAAEITHPAPEGTSNGLLNLAGQVSVVFIYGMAFLKGADGTFTLPLVILIALLGVCSLLSLGLKESALLVAKENPQIAQMGTDRE